MPKNYETEKINNMEQFVNLHLHTEYSLLDGATKIDKLFARCAQLNQPAVAITDHGNMYGAMTFYEAAKSFNAKSDYKVKPIIGCEVYTAPDMTIKVSDTPGVKAKANHLVLLCKDLEGYKNLIKLVSLGYTKGFYYKPRIDFELLKQHRGGLICLSACVAGELPQAILTALDTGDTSFKEANAVIKRFKALFGDDYYIEIQDHKLRAQRAILPHLVRLAGENGVKIVATNDVHYLRKEDARMQKVLQCISFGDKLASNQSANASNMSNDGTVDDDSYFPTEEFYLKSYDEMAEVFPSLTHALTNTLEIADKCGDCSGFFSRHQLTPVYDAPGGLTPTEYLRKLTFDGIKEKYKEITPEVRKRAEYELSTIEDMGFVDYFLIVWDFIHYAESINVPVGPGRGSGAGSIVAYATGITKLDPLKYDLYFERFLNPERVSNPDFDIDFCPERRAEVISYVQNKYGENNVSQIVTFGTMATKAAIKDVGRVLDVPFAEMNKITKLLPKMMGHKTIRHVLGLDAVNAKDIAKAQKEAQANPEKNIEIPDPIYERVEDLIEMYNSDPVIKDVLDLAMQIEGMPRQTGLHAAGVIICKDPISDHTPMSMNSQNLVCTQYNMIQCEALGLLKMDFLGLTNLTDIKTACEYVEKKTGERIDFYNMEYNDPEVYKMIGSGDCAAVFQLENGGMTNFMKELKPDCLEDIIAGISLYRPGPMQYIPTFIHNKKHPKDIKYTHKTLENNLAATYGVMVYQEQVMNICRELAGYSLGGADSIRRFMSKKKKDKLQAEKKTFIYGGTFTNDRGEVVEVAGAVKNGMKESDAETLFAEMEHFAEYAFNKSHAAAYAYITYQTAYLKCHYVKEFMAAVLNNRITNIKEITKYLTYLKERKIPVYPPDVNKSEVEFSVEGEGIRIGLAAIKGVGAAVMQEIVNERQRGGPYTDMMQMIKRIENNGSSKNGGSVMNKKVIENLIYSGACDCFGKNRSVLCQSYELILDRVNSDKKAKVRGQYSMFDMGGDAGLDEVFIYPEVEEFPLREKLRYEKDVTGVYLTGHPLQDFSDKLGEFKHNSMDVIRAGGEEELGEMDDGGVMETVLADNAHITLGGMIISAEKRFSKNGKEFGAGVLEDLYGTVELLVSQNKWQALKNKFVPDIVVSVTGRLSVQDGRTPSVWVDSITEISDSGANKKGKRICCYLEGGEQNEVYPELIDIAKAYPGFDQLYIKNTETGQLFLSPVRLNIDEAHPELSAAVGAKNVKLA